MALHRAGQADAEWLCRILQRSLSDELLNESLFFGLDHPRSTISEWREDFNTARPHSSLGYETRAAYGFSTRAKRRNRNGQGSNRHWMTVQWQVRGIRDLQPSRVRSSQLRPQLSCCFRDGTRGPAVCARWDILSRLSHGLLESKLWAQPPRAEVRARRLHCERRHHAWP
ncbi:integrase core domain-containing protein [Mesorhizobium sp. C264A]|uniref:integrase core domain-containing protein n=1 Tax=Mesorhizobium sp. C264A TaxID=2956825 RepID=UPI003335FA0E